MNSSKVLMLRPEASSDYLRLPAEERKKVELWLEVFALADKLDDRLRALAEIGQRYKIGKSMYYLKRKMYEQHGIIGLVGAKGRRILGHGKTGLPVEFVNFWQSLCAGHQRMKAAQVHRVLFADHLLADKIIPGYDTDWRGIFARENPGQPVPSVCPYQLGVLEPKGWGYRNLASRAPNRDAWAAATLGTATARLYLPSIPHTRVGLKLCSVLVVDDVWHDNKVNYAGSKAAPQRPLELGMMDMLTGRFTAWGVRVPRVRDDGTREMLKESDMLYLLCDQFCRVGVCRDGVLILAEGATAAIRKPVLDKINAHTGGLLRVETSATRSEPMIAGLFAERPRGNPKWKAALESTWNLLHNHLAMLPGQTGKDRDHSPADEAGRDRENSALQRLCKSLPAEVVEHLRAPYLNYFQFTDALLTVKQRIESRTDHQLEGWEQCGFVKQVAVSQDGKVFDLDSERAKGEDTYRALLSYLEASGAAIQCVRMSPAEAWAKREAQEQLLRFPMSLAAVILQTGGLMAKVTPTRQGTLILRNDFSEERLTFLAIVRSDEGFDTRLEYGKSYLATVNPFAARSALVCDAEGAWLGLAPGFVAATHGDREGDQHNLGLWQQALGNQRRDQERLQSRAVDARRDNVLANVRLLANPKTDVDPDDLNDFLARNASGAPREEDNADKAPVF
ncbi:MAG: hypothetical protein ACOYOU_16370 [Kiritimatiellia bacterium]